MLQEGAFGANAKMDTLPFFLATLCNTGKLLVPQPGIRLTPPAVEAQSLNHWTIREVSGCNQVV